MPTFISENQFKNHIEDIDRELLKFDLPLKNKEANTTLPDNHTFSNPDKHPPPGLQSPTSPQILNLTLSTTFTHPTTPNPATSSPNPNPQATWKHITRAVVEHTSREVVVSGMKRTLPNAHHQFELPNKRYVVSQFDGENI